MIKIFSNHEVIKNFSFTDYFDLNGKIIRKAESRETLELNLNNKLFYIKRFYGTSFIQKIWQIIGFKDEVNNAVNEFKAYALLQEIGIETPKLVCFGDDNKFAKRKSFVMAEKILNIAELDSFLVNPKNKILVKKHEDKIFEEVCSIVSRLNINNIIHKDLYLCHFLIDTKLLKTIGKIKIYLIDYHRLEKFSMISNRQKVKEIGDLFFSIKRIKKFSIFINYLKKDSNLKNLYKQNHIAINNRADKLLKKYLKKYGK